MRRGYQNIPGRELCVKSWCMWNNPEGSLCALCKVAGQEPRQGPGHRKGPTQSELCGSVRNRLQGTAPVTVIVLLVILAVVWRTCWIWGCWGMQAGQVLAYRPGLGRREEVGLLARDGSGGSRWAGGEGGDWSGRPSHGGTMTSAPGSLVLGPREATRAELVEKHGTEDGDVDGEKSTLQLLTRATPPLLT